MDTKQKNNSVKEQLQKQLEDYKNDPSKFTSYLETMKKINLWLNSGEKK
ncbi:hypothetical protein KKA17_01260 [bacterium]|nr:hypothetical protein [bacterium]MBU1882927.1 hypothetical protein [bacterium]